MNEKELEYTLKKINEALGGKTYPATPQLFAKLNKQADEKQKRQKEFGRKDDETR